MSLLHILDNIRSKLLEKRQPVETQWKLSIEKEADMLQDFIINGKIDPTSDFPGLVNQGLDISVIHCWRHKYEK